MLRRNIALYTLGLIHYPDDVEFLFRRGDCRKELRQYGAAYDDFNKATLLDTARQFEYINEAIYQRGAMSYLLKDTATAYRDWKAAQEITNHKLRTYEDYCRLFKRHGTD